MRVDACRLCSSSALDTILDWGDVPLTGVFPRPGEAVPVAPLHLARCYRCGLVQLRDSLDPALAFGPSYGYRSGLNPSMVDHLQTVACLAADIRGRTNPARVVVDVGGNDGTLLRNFSDQVTRLNVDPLATQLGQAAGVNSAVYPRLFDDDVARFIVDGIGHADLVFSIAMFYDVDDPLAFARRVHGLLADGGLWTLEVADADAMLMGTVYDTVCHEHVTYWAEPQLRRLATLAGFRVELCERNPTNGGSLLAVLRKATPSPNALDWFERDVAVEWRRFAARVQQHGWWLNGVVKMYSGRKLYALGASTKGNVLMHNVWFRDGQNPQPFIAIGEVNPDKVGRETPVGRIPIVTQDEALAEADDLVVFPWHFRPFFEETVRPRLRPGQRLIYPLPF